MKITKLKKHVAAEKRMSNTKRERHAREDNSNILKTSMWAYNLMVNNIVRSKYIFVENNKIEILFSNYIFRLFFQSQPSKLWKVSPNI